MNITMVLNPSTVEQYPHTMTSADHCIEKAPGQSELAYRLPPMWTQSPTSLQTSDGCPRCPSCLRFADHPEIRLRGLPSPPLSQVGDSGYAQLCSMDVIEEERVKWGGPSMLELRQDIKLPPIRTFDLNVESSRFQPAAAYTRIQLDSVRLNKKKLERRASTSPISSRSHCGPHRTPPRSPRGPDKQCDHDHDLTDPLDTCEGHRCNRPFNPAQVDWIRYHKIDLGISYNAMAPLYDRIWPEEHKSGHCFSARLYRDNFIPRIDRFNNPVYDDKGKVVFDKAKMRDKNEPEGLQKCVPYSMVDRYPWRAVEYAWVRDQERQLARLIMQGIDPTDPTGSKSLSSPPSRAGI
jgi:hypothetical protein